MKSAIPENRASFSLGEIAQVTEGVLSGSPEVIVTGLATDSRAPIPGKLFVALVGERFDGHAFTSAALRNGATALLVERELQSVSVPVVRVRSTLEALSALARQHRRRSRVKRVAGAGSAGKTTTRGAVAAALEAAAPGAVHFAEGNLNNAIGVPLVLLGIEPQHRYAVVEIGTNHTGEVGALVRIAEPDLSVLTLVGLEHTEGLGDLDAVEREEGSIFSYFSGTGIALGNGDDARVARQVERSSALHKLRYGFGPGLEYRIVERAVGELGPARVRLLRPDREELVADCPLLGRPGAYAFAAGVAAAESATGATLTAEALARGFSSRGAEPGRLVPVPLANGAVVLDDTYNSNPASLESSLQAAAEVARARGGRLLLVLGEMRELGEASPSLHREAGAAIRASGAAELIGVSGDARWFLEPFESARTPAVFAADPDAALALLSNKLLSSDVVLVKASRGVHAERIVSGLIAAYGRTA